MRLAPKRAARNARHQRNSNLGLLGIAEEEVVVPVDVILDVLLAAVAVGVAVVAGIAVAVAYDKGLRPAAYCLLPIASAYCLLLPTPSCHQYRC